MKDISHHMKKLNRRVIRSIHREASTVALPEIPNWPDSKREKKKKAKQKMKAATNARIPTSKSPEERNREMRRGRVPIFDRNNASPKHAKASQKKTPRI